MLSQATLKNGLALLTPTQSEATGISRFVSAYQSYFEEATVAGIEVVPAALVPCAAAMQSALAGINAGGAATKIQAGVLAWWSAASSAAGAIWPGHSPPVLSVAPPAGLSTLAAALTLVFSANLAGRLDLDAAASSIATALHAAHAGGVAAVGPPPGSFPIV